MTYIEESIASTVQTAFGREGAMYGSLLSFVAQLSMALWTLVILIAVIRFVDIHVYRHGNAGMVLLETVAPTSAAPATIAASVVVFLGAPSNLLAAPVPAAHAAAYSPYSAEA